MDIVIVLVVDLFVLWSIVCWPWLILFWAAVFEIALWQLLKRSN